MSKKRKIDPSKFLPDPDEVVTERMIVRQNSAVKISSEFGRAAIRITCPFCGARIDGYIWSVAGGGKRCYCDVIHGLGRSYAEVALFTQPYNVNK